MFCFRGYVLGWLHFLPWCLPLTWQGTETSAIKWLGVGRSYFSLAFRVGFPVKRKKQLYNFFTFYFLNILWFSCSCLLLLVNAEKKNKSYKHIQNVSRLKRMCSESGTFLSSVHALKHMYEKVTCVRKVLRSGKRTWELWLFLGIQNAA